MKIHFSAATLVLLFSVVVRPPLALVILTVVTCCLVVAGELINSAIETTVDLVVGEQRVAFAGFAKDAAAGAVTSLAVGALFVAAYLLKATYPWHFLLFTTVHLDGAVLSFGALCILVWMTIRTWFRSNQMRGH